MPRESDPHPRAAIGVVLELAIALQSNTPSPEAIAALVHQLNSLLDAINAPLGKLASAREPILRMGQGLLRFYQETNRREPTIAQALAIASQAAYLQSFKAFLSQDNPKIQTWLQGVSDHSGSDLVAQKLQALQTFVLGDREGRQTLLAFPESALAEHYNAVTLARLTELGIRSNAARKIVEKITLHTHRLLKSTLGACSATIPRLITWYEAREPERRDLDFILDTALEAEYLSRSSATVWAESWRDRDIDVPLQVQPLKWTGEPDAPQKTLALAHWAQQWIKDDYSAHRIMLIQAPSGRGKSCFCRMLANWVYRHVYPQWIPILIPLAEVAVQADVATILATAITQTLAGHTAKTDWLDDPHLRFLFLLDGLDEVVTAGHYPGGSSRFLQAVTHFQETCVQILGKTHRFLITSHPRCLQTGEHRLPRNLERGEILAMTEALREQWITRWSQGVQADPEGFRQYFQEPNLPSALRELTQEPLWLYLLATLHQRGNLRPDQFVGVDTTTAPALLQETLLQSTLGQPSPDGPQQSLTPLQSEGLHRLLQAVALGAVQTGRPAITLTAAIAPPNAPLISPLSSDLATDPATHACLAALRQWLTTHPHPHRFTPFSLEPIPAAVAPAAPENPHPESPKDILLTFTHPTFRAFFCARQLAEGLIKGCQSGSDRPGGDQDFAPSEFALSDDAFASTLYDLLAGPVLTPEIMAYLWPLLIQHPSFQPIPLGQRLLGFYQQWCQGKFIDALPETLPQQKMRHLAGQLRSGVPLVAMSPRGQRQINVLVGLNTLILLLELHRYGQTLSPPDSWQSAAPSAAPPAASLDADDIPLAPPASVPAHPLAFHPCGQPGSPTFDPEQLSQIMGESYCLKGLTFAELLGPFLAQAHLSQVNLTQVNLDYANCPKADFSYAQLAQAHFFQANFEGANLFRVNLTAANLHRTHFQGANLSHANLSRADLRGADLSHANLSHADLSSAFLLGANLRHANLNGANLSHADLSHADLRNTQLNSSNLRKANLSKANLHGAHLRGTTLFNAYLKNAHLNQVNLSYVNLSSANLSGADLTGAILSDEYGAVKWDENTVWKGVQGWDAAVEIPNALKRQLGLELNRF